jgi:transposase
VGSDGTSAPDVSTVKFGLAGFRVLAAGQVGGELELLVETTAARASCPTCARPAAPHARREHLLRDLAHDDRPVFVLWCKRIWRCRHVDCPKRTWSEQSELAAAKASLTGRTRAWAARRVGEHADTVAATARSLGVGWHAVMGAVTEHGRPLIDDAARLADVHALGVDEHAWQRANAHRHTQFASGRSLSLQLLIPGGCLLTDCSQRLSDHSPPGATRHHAHDARAVLHHIHDRRRGPPANGPRTFPS